MLEKMRFKLISDRSDPIVDINPHYNKYNNDLHREN